VRSLAGIHGVDKGRVWADRPHGMVQGDWDALLAFGDKYLMDKPVTRSFDQYPPGVGSNAKWREAAWLVAMVRNIF
jgi:hypothetical protein